MSTRRPSIDSPDGPMCPVCGGNPGLHEGTQCLPETLDAQERSMLLALGLQSAYVRSEDRANCYRLIEFGLAESTAPMWWRRTSLGDAVAAVLAEGGA